MIEDGTFDHGYKLVLVNLYWINILILCFLYD